MAKAKSIKSNAIQTSSGIKKVQVGSNAEKKYLAGGGSIIKGDAGKAAKEARSTELKALNKPGSSTYIPTPDDPGMENMDAINNVKQGQVLGAETADMGNVTATPLNTPSVPTAKDSAVQPTPTQSKFQQGFQQTKATGLPAPTGAGMAASQVQKSLPPASPPINPIETAMEEDETLQAIDQIRKDWDDLTNQRDTTAKEYEKLIKSSGVQGIDTQLVNMQNVINGTEDDIRNEVTAASGFATDSQVMAMASARNKTLIQNYNTLLETKKSKMEYINQMMTFSAQDRQFAQQKLQTDLQFVEMERSYKDKFINAAKEGYNQLINAYGYNGLYNQLKGDPTLVANAERVLGLGAGQLAKMGPTMAQQEDSLNLQIKKQQLANLRKDFDTASASTPSAPEMEKDPDFKKLRGNAELKGALTAYRSAVEAGGAKLKSTTGGASLDALYQDVLQAYRAAKDLGAIQGADLALVDDAVKRATYERSKVGNVLGLGIPGAVKKGKTTRSAKSSIDTAFGALERSNERLNGLIQSKNPEWIDTPYYQAVTGNIISPDEFNSMDALIQ